MKPAVPSRSWWATRRLRPHGHQHHRANHNVKNHFFNALRIPTELRAYNKPGQWNDPDFMYIHRIKDVAKMGEPSMEIKLNTNRRYPDVTLRSIVCRRSFFAELVTHGPTGVLGGERFFPNNKPTLQLHP